VTNVPEHVRTDRLLIRRWRSSDAASLKEATSIAERELKRWMPGFLSDLADVDGFLTKVDALFGQGTYYGYAITKDDQVLGAISVKFEDGEPEVSYWVRTDFSDQGIATEALIGLCDSVSRLDRFADIQLRCDRVNSISRRVAEKAGFTVHSEGRVPKRSAAQTGHELRFGRSGHHTTRS